MIELIRIPIALLPVFIFLLVLILLDSYKLVKLRAVVTSILIGCLAAITCYYLNTWIKELFNVADSSKFIAPFIEEMVKGVFIIYLIRSKKIGFMIDGAIYGFAIGAGFAFVENIFYLYSIENSNLFVWIIRGFGTAIMHGGTTAIFAIFAKGFLEQDPLEKIVRLFPGLCMAILLHGLFNHFIYKPVITTILFLLGVPFLINFVFERSEKMLQEWLEIGFDADAFLLDMIKSGNISSTKLGRYLQALKSNFPGEKVADMLCLIRIHLELTLRAKGILMMRETGFDIPVEADIKEKFEELKYLEKSIGKTGRLAIKPLIHTNSRELWQIYMVRK